MSKSVCSVVIVLRATLLTGTKATMMQHMLLIYGDEAIWATMPQDEVKRTILDAALSRRCA